MPKLASQFLDFLVAHRSDSIDSDSNSINSSRLPSLAEMSKELGLSVALLREQLEVAKAIGLVEVRPRTGIRILPYSFLPAVRQSLSFAISTNWSYFLSFSDLRNHIETAYWDESARLLAPEDHEQLRRLVSQAWIKLGGHPIQIPHHEHRHLHLTIFSKIGNPFVTGLLEAYWESYEAVGLNLYADYEYLQQVWHYHQQMVDAICSGNYEAGFQALVEHRDLLFQRPKKVSIDGKDTAANR